MGKTLYNVFNFRRRNILGIPSTPKKIKKIAHKCYRGDSKRRKLVAFLIKILNLLKLEFLLSYKTYRPIPNCQSFDINSLLNRLEKDLGLGKLYGVLTYPSQSNRKRFYLNLLSEEGQAVAFAKVALNKKNNSSLARELNTIKSLKNKKYSFKIPKILLAGKHLSHKYLVFESFPLDSKSIRANWNSISFEISKEISENTHHKKTIRDLSWWDKFLEKVPREDRAMLLKDIKLKPESLIEVSLAHGDLHNGNTYYANDEIWLIDWEASYRDAPIMSDEIVFFLAKHQGEILSNSILVAKKLGEKFLRQNNKNMKKDIGMALAFLSISGRKDARSMIHNWAHIVEK